MDNKKLAELLYPDVKNDINYYFDKYKSRSVLKGAHITRYAPSPTGYLHVGHLFSCVIHQMLALPASGSFYLRLEDTDQKREIAEAGEILYKVLQSFELEPNEGYRGNLPEKGVFGPYVQSKRLDIYHTFAKYLVSIDRAYPCFCDKLEDKEEIVAKREQEIVENNDTIDRDVCRTLSITEVEEKLAFKLPFALRLKSMGDPNKTFVVKDLVKGERELRENGKDIVLIKSNGVPVYAFAHAVDDTLMGTTVIVRGEDWYSSLPVHIEIFKAFGFSLIPYLHTPNISKLEDGKKRKLSKRKDPEADCRYYLEKGYPIVAVKEYLLNLANSDFEEWRKANIDKSYIDFPFSIDKLSTGNPIFDMAKLNDVSKEYISRLNKHQIYDELLAWAKEYNREFAHYLRTHADYAKSVLNIDREGEKPRKDIYNWSMVSDYYDYMFGAFAKINHDFASVTNIDNVSLYKILNNYVSGYDESLDKDAWFNGVKQLAMSSRFCTDNKLFKLEPHNYHGNLATFCNIIRYAFTGKSNTPDLHSICVLLGREEMQKRLQTIRQKLNV